mmetsp:Transcript_42551/g.40806  ORF Transcript_42551/g.40806 Transcript_42551/m.40806 type:complete len:102 (-) Transcript_42551:12-317(-)
MGAGLVGLSLMGKGFIKGYRHVKAQQGIFTGKPPLGKHYYGGFQQAMSRSEAALILGIRETAGNRQIIEAHRRMMFMNHPDNGGSNYLASKINEAKERLHS